MPNETIEPRKHQTAEPFAAHVSSRESHPRRAGSRRMLFRQPSLLLSGGFAIALVFLISATACGGDSPQQDSQSTAVPAGIMNVITEGVSGYQQEALADAQVTFAEYEHGALNAVSCLQSAGIANSAAQLNSKGTRYSITFSVPQDQPELNDTGLACVQDNFGALDSWWQYVHQPTQEQYDEARQALIACLREAGVSVPESPPPSFFISLGQSPAYQRCIFTIQEEYDVGGFAG